MIDTHSHIYLPEFDEDRDEVVSRALAAGISHIVLPNVDLTTVEPMYELHDAYPCYTSVAMGLHPTEIGNDYKQALDAIAAVGPRAGRAVPGQFRQSFAVVFKAQKHETLPGRHRHVDKPLFLLGDGTDVLHGIVQSVSKDGADIHHVQKLIQL